MGALCLILILLLSLAGCSKPEEQPEQPEPAPVYEGTLRLWAAPGLAGYPVARPDGGWFRGRAEAYEALHAGINVEITLFDSPLELEARLLETSDGPDLVFGRFLPQLGPRLANLAGAVGEAGLEGYHPGALAAFRQGDQLLGLPALLEVHGLALHSQAFAHRAVPLPENGVWTLEQFEQSLGKLSGPDHFGLGFYHLPRYHEWWSLAAGILNPDGSIAAGAEAGLTRLKRWQAEGLIHPDTGKVSAEQIWSHFAEGRIAMLPVAAWAIPLLRAEPYNAQFSVASFPDGLTAGYTYGFSVFRQEDPLKLGALVDLARFMAAPDQQVRLARETGLMPASREAPNPFDQDPHLTQAFALAGFHRPLPAGPDWDAAQPAVSESLLRALIGAEQPDRALEQIKKAMAPAAGQARE